MSARIDVFPELERQPVRWKNGLMVEWEDLPTGQWLWRLVGGNGETVCVSEAYTRKASARRGARRAMSLMASLEAATWWGQSQVVEVSR